MRGRDTPPVLLAVEAISCCFKTPGFPRILAISANPANVDRFRHRVALIPAETTKGAFRRQVRVRTAKSLAEDRGEAALDLDGQRSTEPGHLKNQVDLGPAAVR